MKVVNSAASKSAYLAAIAFMAAIVISSSMRPPEVYTGLPPFSIILSVSFFIIFHLAMLPVISALHAPDWAKVTGFVWIAVDNMLEMMSFFGAGAELIIPMRWGIHLATATWLIGTSMEQKGAFRWFGFLVAIVLLVITFIGPFIDRAMVPQALGLGGILFIFWIFTAGYRLGKRK